MQKNLKLIEKKENYLFKKFKYKKISNKIKKWIFYLFFNAKVIIMSKRYSGKSFKDSSASKKPKLSLKEKRKQKKEKTKKS